MEIEDWNLALVIALCAVVWMKIFADYRKKMMRVLPTVDQVAHRKQEFGNKISQAENLAREITVGIDEMRQKIEDLESKRQKLQDKLNERDMIFIPAGRQMGTDQSGHDDENPQHDVQIKAFCLDRYAVTNLQYKDFVDATGRRTPVHWQGGTFPIDKGDHPVVNVTWEDACAYAEWVNKRLPTEAEWEWAARGSDGREYPWGDQVGQDCANFNSPEIGTSPVDKFPKGQSEFGIWDMCGNVGEWCSDWYDAKYYSRSPESDPKGPPDGRHKVYRGGGYHTNRMDIRALSRHSATPNMYQDYIGFRCAMKSA